jgi:hypothetical protein
VEKIIWEDFCIMWILACLFARVLLNSGSVAIVFSSAGVPFFRASLPNRRCVMPMPARAPGSHGDVAFR